MGEMRGGTKPGRPKGALNKRTAAMIEAIGTKVTPLEYMLSVLHNEEAKPEQRMMAAVQAAPYIHAKLTSTDAKIELDARISDITHRIVKPGD